MLPRHAIPAALVALVVLLLSPPASASTTLRANERTILAEVNKARTVRGLVPLKVDARLQTAARAHSLDMLRRDFFSHAGFQRRMNRAGMSRFAVGENLYWGMGSRTHARAIVIAWLRSPGHRAVLLRPGFRRVGVARAIGNFSGYNGAHMVTANFAGS